MAGGPRVYTLAPGGGFASTLACTPGYKVCYGAENTRTGGYWGVGLEADQSCENCCEFCPSSGNATLDFGPLRCTGGGPVGGDPVGDTGVTASGTNACSETVQLRLFEYPTGSSSASSQWPGVGRVYSLAPGGSFRSTLTCTPGHLVCYGAENLHSTGYWGVGLDGHEGCQDCCTLCPASGGRALSFGSL